MDEELGYGTPGEMASPSDAELAGQGDPMAEDPNAQGGDVEAMIAEGVQAFMQSQDPEIAVQVVMMLAETMGLAGGPEGGAPGGDPMGGGMPAGDPMGGGMPMAKNGGKFGFFGAERAGEFMKYVSK